MKYSVLIHSFLILNALCSDCLYSQNIYHLGEGLKTNGIVYAIEYDSLTSRIYVGGYFTAIGNIEAHNIAVYDNGTWNPLDKGVDGPVKNLKLGGGHLYACGNFENASGVHANQFARWDGIKWHALAGDQPLNDEVLSLEWFQDKLYASGRFTRIGNDTIKGVAEWDGHHWADSGLDNFLHAKGLLSVHDTLWAWGSAYQSLQGHFHHASYFTKGVWTTIPRISGLYPTFSGFTYFQGKLFAISDNTIVKQDGDEWVDYGYGLFDYDVQSIFPFNGELYMVLNGSYLSNEVLITSVRGHQTIAEIKISNPVGAVTAVKQCKRNLWVGGDFIEINYATFLSLAVFKGNAWSNFGHIKGEGYVNSYNHATGYTLLNEHLIVGGNFFYADTTFARHIARWNGDHWESMGEGFDAPVTQVITYKNEIYACGRFIHSGDKVVNHIAKWDGIHWQPLGPGADKFIKGMIVWNDNLYAWGSFSRIGNSGADYFAKFDGTNWSQVYGPWIEDTQPVYDVEEWNGTLNATYLWSQPIRLNINGSWSYVGSEDIGEGRLFNYKGDLYFGASKILKFVSPNWVDMNFPEHTSWDSPRLLNMNDQLFCSLTNEGLYRHDGDVWSYISYIQPYSYFPLGDDRYAITGFFPFVNLVSCQPSPAFNHVAILEFKPPILNIDADTNFICKGESVAFSPISNALYLDCSWYFEGGSPEYSTDECPLVQYDEPGVYFAHLIASNAVGADSTISTFAIEVLEDCITSIHSEELDPSVICIYPNPVTNVLNVQNVSSPPLETYIYNTTGARFPVENSATKTETSFFIDVKSYPPGIYFLVLRFHDHTETLRFVKL